MTAAVPRQTRLASLIVATVWLVVFAVALASVAIAVEHPGATFAGQSTAATGIWLLAGMALTASGLYLWLGAGRSDSAFLFGLAALAWFIAEWNNPGVGSGPLFTVALIANTIAPAVVVHAVLAYPLGRLASRPERAIVAVGYLDAAIVLGLLPALFFDPGARHCPLCPPNLLLVADNPALFDSLTRIGLWLLVSWSAAVAVLAASRYVHSSHAVQRLTAPLLLAGGGYLLLVVAATAHRIAPDLIGGPAAEYWLWVGQAVALCGVGVGVGWSWIIRRRTRSQMASVVLELGRAAPSRGLQELLGRTLGDPKLKVAYPIEGRDRGVDAAGLVVDVPEGSVATPLVRQGRTVALLIHRAGLLDDPGVVDEVVAAAGLALDNERFQAEVRTRIADLRASRARIVAASDTERRRLERDLHDGAQQRLVELSLTLALARTQAREDVILNDVINEAEDRVRRVIEELRDLAHGIYPAVLSSDGLGSAIEALRERGAIPISLLSVTRDRYPGAVESAAYFMVAELTGPVAELARATHVVVDCRRDHDNLRLSVTLKSVHPLNSELEARLVDLEDRIGALDGRLSFEQDPEDGLMVRAEIPCAL